MRGEYKVTRILIGISSCLLGEAVRYDGGHKFDAYINETLSRYFDFAPMCPETAIGLGVPRPTIQLMEREGSVRAISSDAGQDFTEPLRHYADLQQPVHRLLSGYIFKSRSPSCGVGSVTVAQATDIPAPPGTGIYADRLMTNLPSLPVVEETQLGDSVWREHFIKRVYIYQRWHELQRKGLTANRLLDFHQRHRLIVMSHDPDRHRVLAQIASRARSDELEPTSETYFLQLMETLREPTRRHHHVGVLQYLQARLKHRLDGDEKWELTEAIAAYQLGELPLIAPITLLKHHFRKTEDVEARDSWYLNPHPAELNLLNTL